MRRGGGREDNPPKGVTFFAWCVSRRKENFNFRSGKQISFIPEFLTKMNFMIKLEVQILLKLN